MAGKGMHKMPDGSMMRDHAMPKKGAMDHGMMGPPPKGKKAAPMMMIVIAGKPAKSIKAKKK